MARDTKPTKRNAKIHSLVKNYVNQSTQNDRPHGKPKTKGKARAIDDVYEYAPSKVRRAKIKLDLDRHETDGRRGPGNEDEDEMDIAGLGQDGMEKLRARLMRGDEEGGWVDSEDDEDIDSDGAFEESDKEDFAGSGFKRKSSKSRSKASRKKRTKNIPRDVDLNEDSDGQLSVGSSRGSEDEEDEDEEMEEGGSGDFFDVLDVFDGRAEVENEDDQPPKVVKERETPSKVTQEDESEEEWMGAGHSNVDSVERMDSDEDIEEDEEDDEEDEDEEEDAEDEDDFHISASDSEDPSPDALADLESFLSKLDPSESLKRKPHEAPSIEPTSKKRRMIVERTEAGEEGEFGVRGSSTLKLDDLLAPLASSSSSLAALKKSTRALTSSSTKTKTLSAPLPQRAQERLDREAAYEQTKEEVDKWSATMKRIKEAEHLSFPLQAEKPSRVSNLELAAKFTPSTELESAVDKLLKSAQLRDEDIAHTEALKMAHLSVEEVAARRAELKLMRELAFRADRKAKRIAKIKSKTYRRIRKKQRERLDGAGDGGDGDGDGEDEGERLKAEVERARERATLRHKNTGKWAKAMQNREELDQDQRQAITDMLERGEKLRRRIRGEDSGDEDDDRDEDSDDGDEERDEEAIRRGAFEELVALRGEDEDEGGLDLKSKSVFNMKFMRDAAARQAKAADAQAEELARELGFMVNGDEDDGETDTVPSNEAAMVQRTGGRLSFRPGATSAPLRPLGSLASDTSSVTLQSADLIQDVHPPETTPTPTPSILTSTPTPTASTPIINPWLVHSESSGPSRKRDEVRVQKGADASMKASNKLKKQAGRNEEERERARDDAVLEIDANNVLTIPDPPAPVPAPSTSSKDNAKAKAKGKAKTGVPKGSSAVTNGDNDDHDDSDAHSELEEQERAVDRKNRSGAGKGVQAFQQRDLVALAFAGDNVVQAFEEAKRQEMEADAPREVDTTLPGWGTWGGTGTKPHAPKPHLVKKLPGIDPTTRSDYKKAHVIISEKRDKKAAKYLVKELPFPYTSHAQFERGMEVPLGTEWNTRVGFQRGTLPRVVKKMGTVIDPLEKLF